MGRLERLDEKSMQGRGSVVLLSNGGSAGLGDERSCDGRRWPWRAGTGGHACEAGARNETREAALRDLRRGAKQKTVLSSFPSKGAARAWLSLEQRMGSRRDDISG